MSETDMDTIEAKKESNGEATSRLKALLGGRFKPQKQRGYNCFETCLAAILGIEQSEIPEIRGTEWPEKYDKWMKETFGLRLVHCLCAEPFIDAIPEDVYYIVSGELENGGWHSRVRKGNDIILDPSSREYETQDFKHGYDKWYATVIVTDFYKPKAT